RPAANAAVTPFLAGIQMGAHTMLDEGIEPCLDLLRETAAIDTLMTYSHAYGGDVHKPLAWLATDHGKPPLDQRTRKLPQVYVRHHEQYFKDTSLRHQKPDASFEYAGRDLFAEMVGPARSRGMKVFARILESGSREVQNVAKVATINADGRPTQTACWNHPDYRAWWNATVEDLFRTYDLDGFQWGAERMGPLMNVIQPWNDGAPTCFCEHCLGRGRAHGIDPERARKGFEELYVYVRGLIAGKPRRADGVFTGFLRV